MSMEYTIMLGSTASTVTANDESITLADKALASHLIQENLERWTIELCAVFGGCSMSIVDGNYVMKDGRLCTESTFKFTCIKFGDGTIEQAQAWLEVKLIARDMCKVFGQECVLISRHACDAELVEA